MAVNPANIGKWNKNMSKQKSSIPASFRITRQSDGVSWEAVSALLADVRMASRDPEIHRRAFENSFSVVFVYEGERLAGIGRAISDGAYESALYDVAVAPSYQGLGLGDTIVKALLADLDGTNVILFSADGKETFYERFGFRLMRRGMARFIREDEMRAAGFIE
jgi:GNAT superfamily N-acetyltransferase